MKRLAAATLLLSMVAAPGAVSAGDTSTEAVRAVSPALEAYTTKTLYGGLWQRPSLSPRDRSIVTIAALIARNQAADMPAEFDRALVSAGQMEQVGFHLNKALNNGLTQAEASEVLTQLAFYAGWPKVISALPVAKEVFDERAQQ